MELKSSLQCPHTGTIRRNPPRKARATPSTNAPELPFSSSYSSAIHDIPSFPLQEILGIDLPQLPPKGDEISENLRIFLRIRPLQPNQTSKEKINGVHITRPRSKGALPQKEKKKNTKKSESCLAVNNSRSVTLTLPLALQDPKRIKTEVYDGFTRVFSADSRQSEVYESMMDPLVEDFIRGKSGMLAALGPTGSGKTHTVFGCPREPGMVPLALRRIFSQTDGSGSQISRSFYISMFEICSERGKGERIFDLSPNGTDLFLQQSAVKGLQEVMVSDVAQAESLIACGMLKRATAMTNANSKSSRSQCIINIRSAPNTIDGEVEVPPINAVLTIVDLAGAEREKRTGNQGARLLESNFINNTSMVFSLCLRSLLEHQKNPKKPLQKHFQNSLLSRYLRDYLEGKKRMTLIFTVKPGEDDYLDTSFLLRQALPYMKIKFINVEEPSNLPCHKRHIQTFPRVEQPKRRKFSDLDTAIKEGKSAKEECQSREKEKVQELEPLKVSISSPKVIKLELNESALLKEEYCIDMAKRERNDQIMRDFAKALWNVLKQYKKKLEVSENEVHSLEKILTKEKTRYLELEKEMKDLKSCCCCKQVSTEESSSLEVETGTDFGTIGSAQLEGHGSNIVHEVIVDPYSPNLRASECKSDLKICDATVGVRQSHEIFLQIQSSDVVDTSCLCIEDDFKQQNYQVSMDACSPNLKGSECNSNLKECDVTVKQSREISLQVSMDACSPNLKGSECNSNLKECDVTVRQSQEISLQCINQKCESFPGKENNAEDLDELKYLGVVDNSSNADVTVIGSRHSESMVSSSQSQVPVRKEDCSSIEWNKLHLEEEKKLLDPPLPKEDVACTNVCNVQNVQKREPNFNSSSKTLNVEKPKRRLLPASSILLKEISGLELEDEKEKPKGSRGGERKLAAGERMQTQGSISLLRLLKSNLHL